MKEIKNILFAMLFIIPLSIKGQPKIWLDGYVYAEKDSIQEAVPFATLSFFDTEEKTNVVYFTICGPNGNYEVKPYDHKRTYYVVASIPCYEDKEFHVKEIPEYWDSKPFSGNVTVNIKMTSKGESSITKRTFEPSDSVRGLCDYLMKLPNVCKDDVGWTTKSGGGICIFLNGSIANEQILSNMDNIPMDVVSRIDYYELPKGGVYEMALDIVLGIGDKPAFPSYKMKESRFIY